MKNANRLEGAGAVSVGVAAPTLHLGADWRTDKRERLSSAEGHSVDASEDLVAAQ